MSSTSPPQIGPNPLQYSPSNVRNDPRLLESQRAVLKRLKAWHRWERDKRRSLVDFLLRASPLLIPRPALPRNDELLSLAEYYFPYRDDLEVIVFDFEGVKDGAYFPIKRRFETLESSYKYFAEKPDTILFRWIHIPLGAGELSREIQRSFGNATGKSDIEARTLHFKILSLRDSRIVQDQLDVFNLLQDVPESLKQRLDKETWTSIPPPGDINFLGTNFWRAAASDMPGPLSPTSMIDPNRQSRGKASKDFTSTKQCLGRHPDFSDLMLTTDNMSCVSRSDGVLLTTLSSKGLNYLNSFRQRTAWPDVTRFPDDFVLGSLAHEAHLSDVITRPRVKVDELLHTQHVDAFLLSIIVDFYSSPSVKGLDMSGLEDAYEQIAQELRNRFSNRLRRQESLELVRDIVACMNEISQLRKIGENKTQFVQSLSKDGVFPRFEQSIDLILEAKRRELSIIWESDGERAKRIGPSWHKSYIDSQFPKGKEAFERLPLLWEELKSSLDIFFQLKTIEQNEMALLAESNNQAILVFTVVTVVFLPLSFFTSYFGMNLQGISNTTKDERYFWMVCGPVTVSIVLLTLLFGFRKRYKGVLWSDETFSRSKN